MGRASCETASRCCHYFCGLAASLLAGSPRLAGRRRGDGHRRRLEGTETATDKRSLSDRCDCCELLLARQSTGARLSEAKVGGATHAGLSPSRHQCSRTDAFNLHMNYETFDGHTRLRV
jgi:hypothetical protein